FHPNTQPYSQRGLPRSIFLSEVKPPAAAPTAPPINAPGKTPPPTTAEPIAPTPAPMPAPLIALSPVLWPQPASKVNTAKEATYLLDIFIGLSFSGYCLLTRIK